MKKYLSTTQAAKLYGVSLREFQRKVKSGAIKGKKAECGKCWLFAEDYIQQKAIERHAKTFHRSNKVCPHQT